MKKKAVWAKSLLYGIFLVFSVTACGGGSGDIDPDEMTKIYKKSLQGIKPEKQVAFEKLIYKYAKMFSEAQALDGGETKLGAQLRIREEREKSLKQFFLEDNTFFGWVGRVSSPNIEENGLNKGAPIGDNSKWSQPTLRVSFDVGEGYSFNIQSFILQLNQHNISGYDSYNLGVLYYYKNMGIPAEPPLKKGELVVISGGFGTHELVEPFTNRDISDNLEAASGYGSGEYMIRRKGKQSPFYYLNYFQSERDYLVEMSSWKPCNTGKVHWVPPNRRGIDIDPGRCMHGETLSDSVMLYPTFLADIGGKFHYHWSDSIIDPSYFKHEGPEGESNSWLSEHAYPLGCDPEFWRGNNENAAERYGAAKVKASYCTGFLSIARAEIISNAPVNKIYKIPSKDDGIRDYETGRVCECTYDDSPALCGDKPPGSKMDGDKNYDPFSSLGCASWEERVKLREADLFCEGKPEDTQIPGGGIC